jgi:flagellar protein FliS
MNALMKIKSYVDVGVESNVHSADPHKLIVLLYQGALLSIAAARNHMLRKEIAAKGKSISQAISIIDEGLKASLNKEVGGELAANLAALYEYMTARLFHANLANDPAALDEVAGLLGELRGAWESIRKTAVAVPVAAAVPTAPATDPVAQAYGTRPAPRVFERA